MRFLVILLCLKIIGVLGEQQAGELIINKVDVTEKYRYHDNLQTHILCNSRGDEDNVVTIKYVPQEGEPITTIAKRYFNTMDMKLTSDDHNATIECHITGKENLTLSTRLENIEILKASGLYDSNDVVRGFEVNGMLLSNQERKRHQKRGHHYYDYDAYIDETLIVKFLKADSENASCEFEGFINYWDLVSDPFTDYNNFTYKIVFREYGTPCMTCAIYRDNNEIEHFVLHLFSPNKNDEPSIKGLPRSNMLMSYKVDNIASTCKPPQGNNSTRNQIFVKLEYRKHTLTCNDIWCYDETQVECPERTEENKTPKICTFTLKDGQNESIVACAATDTGIDNYVQIVRKQQPVVAS